MLHFQMQNQVLIQTIFPIVRYTSSAMPAGVYAVKPFNFPAPSKNNGQGMRQVGKTMIVAGGAIYLLGAMTATTNGNGNLEAGTKIAVTGAVVCATGVPLFFIGRHKMKHAK